MKTNINTTYLNGREKEKRKYREEKKKTSKNLREPG